jgi:hypothetical protein
MSNPQTMGSEAFSRRASILAVRVLQHGEWDHSQHKRILG